MAVPALADLLYLLTIPNIGPGRIRRLLQVFSTLEEIKRAPVQRLVQVEGIDTTLAAQIKSGGDPAAVEEQLNYLAKYGIRTVSIWEKDYPPLLKRIPDPPVVLFYVGDVGVLREPGLAVVGTRTPSSYGKWAATHFTRELTQRGITIISGLARGVDTIAHQTALRTGGKTVAVLGCGVERCYPPENLKIYRQIPRQGALLSEFFIGTGPDATNFPRRNRIISGLSQGTLVIEAGERSGALITAFYALNHNREVFAVPGNVNNPKSTGCNRLIQQGAKLVQTVDDILEEIEQLLPREKPVERPLPENLGELEQKVYRLLSDEPKHIDYLVMELQEPPSVVLSALLSLELLGFAQQLAGKMFVRL